MPNRFLATVLTLALVPATPPPAVAQGGPSEAAVGAAVSIGLALLNEVKNAIQTLGTAVSYCKAKTDGPDADDRAVAFDFDRDRGLDWSLDCDTHLVEGTNDVDNGEEVPYTPEDSHNAQIELHWNSTGGVWVPDPDDCDFCPKGQEFDGWVSAVPEDDPTAKDQETVAVAAAAFSVDGTTADFCYGASTSTTPAGRLTFESVKKVPCPGGDKAAGAALGARQEELPSFALTHGAVFLASPGRFRFRALPGDQVRIEPRLGPVIDVFHTYLQRPSDDSIFPLLRGYHPAAEELRREGYADRVAGTEWTLSEDPTATADLTVVGAAVELLPFQLPRAGRTDLELLDAYFDSEAVRVVAPRNAQPGYHPRSILRAPVRSGQDLSALVGREYVLPPNGDPDAPVEEDPLVGLLLGVEGNVDDAVVLALETEGSFVRTLAEDAIAPGAETVELTVPGLDFHHENPSTLFDVAVASPAGDTTWYFLGDAQGGLITFTIAGVHLFVETVQGQTAEDVAAAVAAAINRDPTLAERGITATADGTRVDTDGFITETQVEDPGLFHGSEPLADCNGNGVPDGQDVAIGDAVDRDGNEVPDACEIRSCRAGTVPAATLLYPYFEVDLDDPAGLTTLFSVNNAGEECRLVRVTLWTDLAVPTLTFYLYLSPGDVQTLNARNLLAGRLPGAAGHPDCPALSPEICTAADFSPSLGPARLARLAAAHVGAADPVTGLCSGIDRGDDVAVGYATADAVLACAPAATVTSHAVLSEHLGGADLAMSNDLWGDFFLVDARGNFAQSEAAVAVRAQPARFGAGDLTFYGRYNVGDGSDAREPLPGTYGTRFLNGGVFDGGTDLLVWRDTRSPEMQPVPCGALPEWAPLGQRGLRGRDEDQNPFPISATHAFPWATQRVATGEPGLDVPVPFGWLRLGLWHDAATPAQAAVVPVLTALGRFSVGHAPVAFDDLCAERTSGEVPPVQ